MASAPYHLFQRLVGVFHAVERTMEGHLHPFGGSNRSLSALDIHLAVGSEETHHHTLGASLAAASYVVKNLTVFVVRVAEVAPARAYQHVGTQPQVVDAVADILHPRGRAPDIEVLAQFYPAGSASLSVLRRAPSRRTYLNLYHISVIVVSHFPHANIGKKSHFLHDFRAKKHIFQAHHRSNYFL